MEWITIGYCTLAAVLFMSLIFLIAKHRNRFDLIDVAWGLVFISIAAVSYQAGQAYQLVSVQSLLALLVVLWGVRLSVHTYRRWRHADREDFRYRMLRQEYSKNWGGVDANMFVWVYVMQALAAVIVSLPVIITNAHGPLPIGWLSVVGGVVWVVGFYFETVADRQLAQFRRNHRNKGKLMKRGLWRYSRHPNYFGELVQWWGIFIIALSAPLWWLSLIGPAALTLLVVFVTGPRLEKHLARKLGWTEYKKRTGALLPLPHQN